MVVSNDDRINFSFFVFQQQLLANQQQNSILRSPSTSNLQQSTIQSILNKNSTRFHPYKSPGTPKNSLLTPEQLAKAVMQTTTPNLAQNSCLNLGNQLGSTLNFNRSPQPNQLLSNTLLPNQNMAVLLEKLKGNHANQNDLVNPNNSIFNTLSQHTLPTSVTAPSGIQTSTLNNEQVTNQNSKSSTPPVDNSTSTTQ